MTRGRNLILVGVAVIALLIGAFELRTRLQARTSATWPPLTPPSLPVVQPTPTPTPGLRIRLVTPEPAATSAPPAAPPTALPTPAPQPTAGRSSLYFPYVASNQSDPPFPLDTRLTPEGRPILTPTSMPVPTAAPTPAPVAPTVTPAPPPTPVATRCPQRVTKLGIGLYDSGGAFLPALDQLRPSTILLMDPTVDFAQEVRRWFPNAFIVGRIYQKDQPLDNPSAQGAAFADLVAQRAAPLKGTVDAWMSYNEITGHKDVNNYRAYNAFQVAFAQRLQGNYGIPAVAGNDGPGTVEPQEYAQYFREAITASQYFGVHAYAPYGETSMRIPRSQDLVLRYRQIRDALVAAGVPVRDGQFVITEAGLYDGWRGVASEESMAQDFLWFGDRLSEDSYVKGAAVFGLFVGDRWERFNIAGTLIARKIGEYNTQCPG